MQISETMKTWRDLKPPLSPPLCFSLLFAPLLHSVLSYSLLLSSLLFGVAPCESPTTVSVEYCNATIRFPFVCFGLSFRDGWTGSMDGWSRAALPSSLSKFCTTSSPLLYCTSRHPTRKDARLFHVNFNWILKYILRGLLSKPSIPDIDGLNTHYVI